MVRRGLGIGVLMEEHAAPFAELQVALPDVPPIPTATWLATHRELHSSRRIRVVFDLLADALG